MICSMLERPGWRKATHVVVVRIQRVKEELGREMHTVTHLS